VQRICREFGAQIIDKRNDQKQRLRKVSRFGVRKAAITCPFYSERLPDSEGNRWEWVLLVVAPGFV